MLKLLIILAVIFYILPRLIKWALKGFIVSQVNKAQQDMRQSQKAYQTQQKREGDIDVNFVPKKNEKKSENFGGGEYVDYEEVK
jgi:membrane-anchored glycerophosphoryl diester phosphodiesterase (GDPDase)